MQESFWQADHKAVDSLCCVLTIAVCSYKDIKSNTMSAKQQTQSIVLQQQWHGLESSSGLITKLPMTWRGLANLSFFFHRIA